MEDEVRILTGILRKQLHKDNINCKRACVSRVTIEFVLTEKLEGRSERIK
jgi:hypothetical protein